MLVREEATCGVVAAQRSAGMAQRYVREVTGQDNALRLHASLGFCRLVDGDEFVALGFQVVDDFLALLNSGRQGTDAGEKDLAQAVTKIKISHDVLL